MEKKDHHQYCCRSLWQNHNSMILLCFCFYVTFTLVVNINVCAADSSGPLQDVCPTAPPADQQKNNIFINGYLCKNPALVAPSDFKSSELDHAGNTDNFLQSSVTLVTAAEYPGLNTQGLSIARTDMAVGGLVLPHSHPRASEMLHVYSGIVIAGFIDSRGKLFQNYLRAGDTVVFPRGLIHFSLNGGFELATAFSVLNSQNPGVVRVADAMFSPEDHVGVEELVKRLFTLSGNGTTTVPARGEGAPFRLIQRPDHI